MLAIATLATLLPALGAFAAPMAANLTAPLPPAGGVDVNATAPPPDYMYKSEFDYQSLALALHQEWIELDLFNYGLERFSAEEFEQYGINAEYRQLIKFMADQEVGHATLISNMLGERAPKQCTYKYDFDTVPEYIDFCQRLTRWGESGVYGFLSHLDSRPAATLLLQSITTEARQQMIFRQFEGLFPMPVYFEVGIPQAFAWTLLNPYIVSCPAENEPIAFQVFPGLEVLNNTAIDNEFQSGAYPNAGPAISHNRDPISVAGDTIELNWKDPGYLVTPYNQTATLGSMVEANSSAPLYVAWINQLNTTYTPLTVTGANAGTTVQPNGTVFEQTPLDPIINGTTFVVIVSEMLPVTPYNLSLINDYVVAGPAIFQAA